VITWHRQGSPTRTEEKKLQQLETPLIPTSSCANPPSPEDTPSLEYPPAPVPSSNAAMLAAPGHSLSSGEVQHVDPYNLSFNAPVQSSNAGMVAAPVPAPSSGETSSAAKVAPEPTSSSGDVQPVQSSNVQWWPLS
jgi:hypothetical protein